MPGPNRTKMDSRRGEDNRNSGRDGDSYTNEYEYEKRDDGDRRGRDYYRYERDYRNRRSRSPERNGGSDKSDRRYNRSGEDNYRDVRSRGNLIIDTSARIDYRVGDKETRASPRDSYRDRRDDSYIGSKDGHNRDQHNKGYIQSRTNRYDLPTTESLHSKKLTALDHEKFLQDRQRDRMAKANVEGLWPKTPPRAEFYFGDVSNEAEAEAGEAENSSKYIVETAAVESVKMVDDENEAVEEFDMKIKVKAPSASKPSINSFSTSKPTKYGGDLMPGEGTAMAGFIAQGQRIPRRGEIGMDSDQISRFETAGYVMSGSRHHLMNAVRMRKENQVISAEEKKMISQMALEERVKREEEIVKTFKSMVEDKMKQQQKK